MLRYPLTDNSSGKIISVNKNNLIVKAEDGLVDITTLNTARQVFATKWSYRSVEQKTLLKNTVLQVSNTVQIP